MSNEVDDFLNGGAMPYFKPTTIGEKIKGTVVSAEVSQQTEPGGKLKTFDDGNPMKQLVVVLQTAERDPNVDGDEGLRRVFIKGQMQKVVAAALREKGVKLELGGTLVVQFVDTEPPKTKGYDPTKLYKAAYAPPAFDAANSILDDTPTPAPAAAGPTADDLLD